MNQKDVLRKGLTFGADALSIIAGSIICAITYRPGTSLAETLRSVQTVIPMLLVTMALMSGIMKIYRDPILKNLSSSMALTIGAFVIAFAMSVILILLSANTPLDTAFLINLLVYSVFFLESYRLAFALKYRLDCSSGVKRQKAASDLLLKQNLNETRIEDLLGRTDVMKDAQSVGSYVAGKTVFVSGGAGSIGFEICSQLLSYNARLVVIFDLNENKLFETQTELSLRYPKTQFVCCIGSIQDRARLRDVFDLYKPEIVIHSAGYKHVPIMESNRQEALKNNVMGTLYMVEAAIKHRADRFILLSTDMAFNPTNILGASKRVEEMLIQRANSWSTTRFSAVRFGSAIASRGSIVQLFIKQIQSGGPVYVTDKHHQNYLMTIPEAVQLILETGALAKGGEIFALSLGEPVNIYELAKSMICSAGLRPDKDIKIEITGFHTAGNYLNDICLPEETVTKTAHDRLFVLKANENPPEMFEAEFDKLCQSIDKRDYDAAFNKVSILVPAFHNIRA